ncbi:MAG: non-ribosomal peptide synthetase, partial [Sulfurovum sp.]
MQLVSRVRSELGVELILKDLFAKPTIAHLIMLLSQASKSTITQIKAQSNRMHFPLSYAQERLWFLDQFEQEKSTLYHMPVRLKLHGKLNKDALKQSFESIVQRHESLRTNFVEKEGVALQQVNQRDDFTIEEIVCKETEIHTLSQKILSTPFDLEKDMLFRVTLFTLDTQTHYLLVNMHHIISDGWSMGILIEEFIMLYTAYMHAQENPLLPLEIHYGDYALWQRAYLSGEILETKLAYWKDTLLGVEPLALPTSYTRPNILSHKGQSISFSIDKEISTKLNQLSRKYDVTLFMTLLSSFGLLLHQYSGKEDIYLGTYVSGRNTLQVEPLIGFFANPLVLKQSFQKNIKFHTLLQQTKEHTLHAYEHQDLPIEKIIDALTLPRDTSGSPLFQVMFILHNTQEKRIELPNLSITSQTLPRDVSRFEITLDMQERQGILHGTLEYATDLFSQSYIEAMITHFKILLEAIVKDETQLLSSYSLLTKEEKKQLLVEYNDTKAPYPKEKTIHQLFEEQVKRTPENIAVIYEDKTLTYAQLNTHANQLAHYLIKQGVQPDSLVALCVERSLDMMIGILAILKAGGAYVPIDPSYPAGRIAHMLEDTHATVLLTQASLVSQLPKTHSNILTIDTLDVSGEKKSHPKTAVTSHHLAYVIYTSGSTGKPKGVMVEHGGVVN